MSTSASPFGRRAEAPRSWPWVLLAPRAAFEGQRRRPRGVLLLVLLLATSTLPAVVFVARADLRGFVEKELRRSGQYEKLPEEQREIALDLGPKLAMIGGPIGAAGARAVWILSLALMGFAFLRGSSPGLTFRLALSAAALGSMPHALRDLSETALFLLQDPARFSADNPLQSNLAALFSLDVRASVAGALLRKVDLFEIWAAVLVGTGLDVVRGRRGRAGLAVSFGVLAAFALVGAMNAAIAAAVS